MYRTLSARAVVPVAVAITGFVVICCVLLYASMKKDMIDGAFAQERSLASTVIKSAHYTMLKADREGLANIVANIGSGEGVEHVRIINSAGAVAFSSRKGETALPVERAVADLSAARGGRLFINGEGNEVLAIRVPIPNEDSCSTAACHFHQAAQKELGVLDIGLSTKPLRGNLAVMRNRMLVFCLMILVLTIGGVAALLKRTVFTPVHQLTEFSDGLVAGEPLEIPHHLGGELGRLAKNLKQSSEELKKARQLARHESQAAPGTGADVQR
ncbi:HAMP domain-containing protein [Geomesophilobacter sediminis]|uniref:HAMP domain-containing protein n=1 Tax=Geomesophilobacter sediminis TaxID=2798584 RepID=A0A8J7S6R2_9BACT|nr:HAMP domain-containing protein [Geomesophilobacter sediminis]MBJ6726566.1 HAMP domain-containing protein [Geomesophilobacter sediminis]